MSDYLNDRQKAAVEKKGVEDALKGEYNPSRAKPSVWCARANEEAETVYREAFYRARGSTPPKR